MAQKENTGNRQEGFARLRVLADHLIAGNLFHDRFDIQTWHRVDTCGTAGCAIGEAVFLFPELLMFGHGAPIVKGAPAHVSSVFGLDLAEFWHLFLCNRNKCQVPETYGSRVLTENATHQDVASNILAFLEKMGDRK